MKEKRKVVDPDVVLLQAAADTTRLAIIQQLSGEGPVCACDFTACCDIAQPTVSHHLKVLREGGWVEQERRGTWIWYSLRPEAVERFGQLARQFRPEATASAGAFQRDTRVIPLGPQG